MPRRAIAIAGLVLILIPGVNPAVAEDRPTEKQKIETLIKHVEGLKDGKFVRNDKEYDAKTAAKFLRGKWEAKESDIKSAKEFIAKIASVSSTTGKAYLIRFKDGKEVKSADYLLGELEKLEKAPKEKP